MANKYLQRREEINRDADAKTDQLIAQVRADLLIPFCNRTGYKFTAGMGSWSFCKRDRYGVRQHLGTSDRISGIPKTLIDFLQEDSVTSNNDLGSLMQDYTPPSYVD